MAIGSIVEFVHARHPEVVRMDASEYKIIQPKRASPKVTSSDSSSSESESDEYSDEEVSSDDNSSTSEQSDEDEYTTNNNLGPSAVSSKDSSLDLLTPSVASAAATTSSAASTIKPLPTSSFYDINENPNDTGTREPHRIHKSWHPAAKELVGLENQGVTCYQNAAVQTLLHIPAVGRYLLEVLNGQHPKVSKSSVTYDLAALFKKLMERRRAIFPRNLIRRLEDINPMLSEWNQEDSHEYFMSLVSRLQEDGVPKGEKLSSSIICDIFGGSVEQKVTCQVCKTVSTTNQDFYDLPVSFSQHQSNGGYTLEQSINDFFTPEVIETGSKGSGGGYQCEKCKEKTKAVKQIAIHEAPECLTIHIKRFKMDGNVSKKVKDTMAYPIEMDLTQYETQDRLDDPLRYKLLAVIVHEGRTLSSGHYIALTRQPNNEWKVYDDEQTSKIRESAVANNSSAYILVYSRLLEKPASKTKRLKEKKSEKTMMAEKAKSGKAKSETPSEKTPPERTASEKFKAGKKKIAKQGKTSKAESSRKSISQKTKLAGEKSRTQTKRLTSEAIDDIFNKRRKTA